MEVKKDYYSLQTNQYIDVYLYAVDGTWNDWGDWEDCPISCGGGTHSRSRTCNEPTCNSVIDECGAACAADGSSDTETEDCNTQECPSKFNKFSQA